MVSMWKDYLGEIFNFQNAVRWHPVGRRWIEVDTVDGTKAYVSYEFIKRLPPAYIFGKASATAIGQSPEPVPRSIMC